MGFPAKMEKVSLRRLPSSKRRGNSGGGSGLVVAAVPCFEALPVWLWLKRS